ncbi:iron chelate uptake ABC transporter family permease subunit, partial [Serratia nevei]
VAPAEMPVGLMTSLIGGPYFLWLVMRQRERAGG